jgi:hypothetical protein
MKNKKKYFGLFRLARVFSKKATIVMPHKGWIAKKFYMLKP